MSSSSDSRSTSTTTIPTDTSRRHDPPERFQDDGHPSSTPSEPPPPPALRKVPSMLPKITPELLREHRSQKQVTEEWSTMPTTRRTSGWRRSEATATAATTTTTDVSPMEDVGGEPSLAGMGCLSRSSCFCGCWSYGPKVDPSHQRPPPSEPKTICGIPYYLVMILSALLAAVTVGALLTVLYRDHNDDLTMMIDATLSPTPSPSLSNA